MVQPAVAADHLRRQLGIELYEGLRPGGRTVWHIAAPIPALGNARGEAFHQTAHFGRADAPCPRQPQQPRALICDQQVQRGVQCVRGVFAQK